MKQIRLALIGIGGYGATLSKSIQSVPSLKIVACYHPKNTKAEKAAQLLNCRASLNEKDAFFNHDIDGVVIATPDPSHLHYINLGVQAGLHIFVEKPMVSSLDEALQLEKILSAYCNTFMVGHNMRRFPGFRYIKKEFISGKLGKLVTFQISLSHGGAFDWDRQYWRTQLDLCREGPMRVNGVHASDVLEYLFGKIDKVYAVFGDHFTSHTSPDSGIALAQIKNAWGSITTHWTVPSLNHFRFQFTNAHVDYDLTTLSLRYGRDVQCKPNESVIVNLPEVDSRKEQFEAFSNSITHGKAVETGFEQGLRAVIFFEACYRSTRDKTPITLSRI